MVLIAAEMTGTQEMVLWAMRHNVKSAKTEKMRQFHQKQLDAYLEKLKNESRPTYNNPLERFALALEK